MLEMTGHVDKSLIGLLRQQFLANPEPSGSSRIKPEAHEAEAKNDRARDQHSLFILVPGRD